MILDSELLVYIIDVLWLKNSLWILLLQGLVCLYIRYTPYAHLSDLRAYIKCLSLFPSGLRMATNILKPAVIMSGILRGIERELPGIDILCVVDLKLERTATAIRVSLSKCRPCWGCASATAD